MNKGLLRYRLLLRLLAPLILIFNAWQAARAGEIRLFRHRLGVCLPRRDDQPLWLHAASVGELIAAQPLIAALRKNFPEVAVVVTTVTATGAQLAQQRLPAEVQHFYLPMDWPGATKRFLRAIKPRAALIMETELWPNLFLNISRQNIPLLIVNGRLSHRSRDAGGWVKLLYAIALKNVDAILARSQDDADAYIQLGAAADKVHMLGNIKFAGDDSKQITAIDLGRPYVLAASTHDDEEQQLAQLWQQMAADTQGRLLVIAPRHPQRRDEILKQLSTHKVAVRSRNETITADTQIYLADTLGELESFMAGADCLFMGGSLIPHGGHNILEPARLGKPIVFGPHMSNFSEETHLLLYAGGAKQIQTPQELSDVLSDWLARPGAAAEFGQNAAQLLSQQDSVLDDYLQAISDICRLTTAEQR
jgi:3-deoxy-D-manno-octulosonic-acid transferase